MALTGLNFQYGFFEHGVAREIFGKHNMSTKEGLHLALNLVLVLV